MIGRSSSFVVVCALAVALSGQSSAVQGAAPVSWWRGEDNALDSVGDNHATAVGGVSYSPGRLGRGFALDGSGHLELDSTQAANLEFVNGFTVSAWVYLDGYVNAAPVVNLRTSANASGFTLEQEYGNPSHLSAAINLTGVPQDFMSLSAGGLTLGEWQHVAVTFDGTAGRLTIYRNGVAAASRSDLVGTMASTANSRFEIGRNIVTTASWDGGIDEVKVFDHALSAVEIGVLASAETQVFDLRQDWSDLNNPNGVWSFREGGSVLPGVDSWQRTLGGWTVAQPGWADSEDGVDRLPFWFRSNGSENFSPDFVAGDVVMHTTDSANGVGNGLGNVVWTSPAAGVVDVAGAVWMGRDIGRANDWRLYRNEVLLTQGRLGSGDAFSRALPMNFAQGDVGPGPLFGITVDAGTTLRLEFERSSSFGDFVGANLSVLLTPGAGAGASPLAWWRFDESGGSTADDCAGRYPGVLLGGAVFAPGEGVAGGSIDLHHATDDLVNMGNVLPLTATNFSIQAWVRTFTVGSESITIVAKHRSTEVAGYILRVNRDAGNYGADGKASFYQSSTQVDSPISSSTITDGAWHQLLASYTLGGSVRLYVDGELEATLPSQTIQPNNAPFLIGGILFGNTPTNLFTGQVDEVQVYDFPLSAGQVLYLFEHPGAALASGLGVAAFSKCMDGPEIDFSAGCGDYDFDGDGDVDLGDYARLLRPFECRVAQ